jgi:hypothetical protein
MLDTDDNQVGVDLWFFKKNKNVLGTLGDVVNASDDAIKANMPLGCVTIPDLDSGVGDYVLGTILTKTGIDLVIDSDPADEGNIYVAGIGTATKTYTASGIQLTFGFEVL